MNNCIAASSTALPTPVTGTVTIQTSPVLTQTSLIPTESGKALSLYISMGVSGVVVVLIAATAVIVISVTVCLKKKKKSKHFNTLTDNVAYGVCEREEMELSVNAAYNTTFDNLHNNVAYGVSEKEMELSANAAYNATFDNLHNNVAYGVSEKEMELSTNAAYNATFNNLHDKEYVYDYIDTTDISITTVPNEAYATSDVPLSSNPAYGVQH